MKKYLLLIPALFIFFSLSAQNRQKPCSAPEASQFDFWIGTWDLYSADTITGSNTIYKIMDGCTVQENFSNPKTGYLGKSWSVYNPQSKQWQQTWVDNQGGYIALTGTFENGRLTLFTETRKLPNGKEQQFRMVYRDISANTFNWDWEMTTDAGKTWTPNWQIRYVRKA